MTISPEAEFGFFGGHRVVREYSYLKMIFRLCIREIISKLLFMQEPTNIYYITKKPQL